MAHDNRTLGEVIHDARAKAERGLREVSRELKITPSYLSDIENDRRIPSEEVLHKLASVFSLDHDDLMARAGRLGDDAVRYLMRTPALGALFRRLAQERATGEDVEKLMQYRDRQSGRKKEEEK
jgi:transcriptional regulator with XRE-family HTH domain